MFRRLVIVVVALSFLAAAPQTSPTASASTASDESAMFAMTNAARAAAGRAPLAYDAAASSVARAWAQELARSHHLRHNPDLAAQLDAHVTRDWRRLGENVGYAGYPEQMQQAYMESTPHRENLLATHYNRIGVGAARSSDGLLWTTMIFFQASTQSAVTVPAATFAPFGSAAAFATQQYRDLLGRAPDERGLLTWTAQLQSGAVTPAGMVASFVQSAEFGALVEPVNRLYAAYFHRNPDAGGVLHWLSRLRTGETLRAVSNAFARSAEFVATYGNLGNQSFVELVYRNVLGRVADLGGLLHWVGQLVSGLLDRGGVMLGFSESAEYKSATWAWNDVVSIYVGLLRRAPDAAGLRHWSSQLTSGRSLADLVGGILGSPEYQGRRFA